MKILLLLILSMFCFSAASAVIEYKPAEYGLTYNRENVGYRHFNRRKIIRVTYHEWAENSSGKIVIPKTSKVYTINGSYYFELSLASSGATPIGDFLDAAIAARLNTAGDVQDSIEAGRDQKDIDMIALGYTP